MKKQRSSAFNSRQYMLSQDFEVYYYSDLHFRSVGSHSHDYYEFYFFVNGAVSMEIGGTACPLRQGDVIVVPPGVQHQAMLSQTDVPYRRFVFWLSRDYCDRLFRQSADYGYLLKKAAEEGKYIYHFDALTFNSLRAILFSLLDELHAPRFAGQTQISLLICQLLLQLNRLVYEQEQSGNRQESLSKYQAISAYIDTHLDEELSLDSLAGAFFLSKYYIAHLFQQNTGLSVHQYITKKRLSACCGAIRGGAVIGEVYGSYGFRDYSSFYRAFRKEYGMPPSAYRELHQGGR